MTCLSIVMVLHYLYRAAVSALFSFVVLLCSKVTFYTVVWANKERKKKKEMFVRAGSCDARTEDHLHVVKIFRPELTPTARSVLSLELAGIFVPSSAADIVAIRAFCSVAAYEYSSTIFVCGRDDRQRFFTHALPSIRMQSVPIPFHSHSQV